MKITLALSAYADLESIETYYTKQEVSHIGSEFISQIFEKIEHLTSHPKMGRVVPECNIEHTRELIFPPFRIIYTTKNNAIQIIRIWRSERLLKITDLDPHSINESSRNYQS